MKYCIVIVMIIMEMIIRLSERILFIIFKVFDVNNFKNVKVYLDK